MTTPLSPAVHTMGLVRRGDPVTSYQAATSLRDLRASQREVLELFRRYGAMDDRALVQCARHAGVKQSPSGLRTRRAELVRKGYLCDSGRRVVSTASQRHRPRVIWALAPGV